jgi:hypothetical protein
MWGDPEMAALMANPSCNGPVAYVDQSLVDALTWPANGRSGRR